MARNWQLSDAELEKLFGNAAYLGITDSASEKISPELRERLRAKLREKVAQQAQARERANQRLENLSPTAQSIVQGEKPAPQPHTPDVQVHTAQPTHLFFRVRGRRYAVPLNEVTTLGRVPAGSWVRTRVVTSRGEFPLYNIKSAFRLDGEAGEFFIAVTNGHQTIAWAVDGIEGVRAVDLALIRPLAALGVTIQNRLINGVMRGHTKEESPWSAGSQATVFFLNTATLQKPLGTRF